MRRVFIVLLLGITCVPSMTAAPVEELFRQGIAAYKAGSYEASVGLFDSVRAAGKDGFILQYNLGCAHYKNGDIGKSILAFERALRFDPGNVDAMHNLNVVRARTRDRIEPIPLIFVVQWWNDVKDAHLPSTFFLWSALFLSLLAASAFVFLGFRGTMLRRSALATGFLAALLFIAALGLYRERVRELEQQRFAVVMQAIVTARSTADASAVDSFTMHEGLTVEILRESNGQYLVRLADGKQGWVPSGTVERI